MRLRAWSIIGIVLLAIGSFGSNAGVSKAQTSTIQNDGAPKIFNARVKG